MHFSCLTSGTLLARLGRPEVSNCIGGLKQYSYAYDEAGDEATDMERVYHAALAGETEINHMASVISQTQSQASQAMVIDQTGFGQNGATTHSVR